ncbi:alpha/beta fold hydrolase [Paracidovorax sp. MALMAid1276]|uniref:alpha/beta fold hydrolase n=1 Tax=Paracidovorax sp. MALMAid1276 TaxID=3411631 RepID=UPI003B9A5DD7
MNKLTQSSKTARIILRLTAAGLTLASLFAIGANAQTSPTHVASGVSPAVREMDVGDTRLQYVEQGIGTPVIFVHGAGGDWRTWEPLRAGIAEHHRFVSYSRRYHWPNDHLGNGKPYTVPEQARDLIAFAQAVGSGPVHVVGGSYGARVVLEAAVQRPELFKTVSASEAAITRPAVWRLWSMWQAKQLADDLGLIAEPMKTGDTVGATVRLVNAVYGSPTAWDQLAADRKQRFLDNQKSWLALARAPQLPSTPCELLGRLPMPVLVLEGEQTVAGFRVTNDRLMECLPSGSERFVIPGAPHIWYPVNPNAAVQRILQFIAKAGG